MNLKTKLEEMRKRCEAATPGPWYTEETEVRHDYDPETTDSGLSDSSVEICNVSRINPELDFRSKDREFIAASRTDMPALIDALEVCLEALEREIFRQEKDDGGAFNHLTNAIAQAEEILGNVSAAPNEEKT